MGHLGGLGVARDLAEGFLRAVDEGHPAGPLARTLSVEVLRSMAADSAPWVLAVEVLEGGPLRMRRAVELAGQVFEAAEVEEGEGACSAG